MSQTASNWTIRINNDWEGLYPVEYNRKPRVHTDVTSSKPVSTLKARNGYLHWLEHFPTQYIITTEGKRTASQTPHHPHAQTSSPTCSGPAGGYLDTMSVPTGCVGKVITAWHPIPAKGAQQLI